MPINQYIENINRLYKTGNAREHSYRGDLQVLINTIVTDVLVTNEPARTECGAPDYIITKRDIPVGYIEAKELQSLHTERRDKIAMIDKRLESSQVQKDKRKPSWIWTEADNKDWFETKLESINTNLFKGAKLSVSLDKGELQFFINGISIFEIFLEEKESLFIYLQWKQKIRGINVTEKYNAKSLVTELLDLVKTENSAVKDQVTALDKEIDALDKMISAKEKEMNAIVYGLYGLTDEEILLVERG